MKTYTDIELLGKAQSDSKEALSELCSRYYAYIKTCCRKVIGDNALAEDMTQEAFSLMIAGLDHFDTKREDANFKAYLRRCAINICRKYIQHYSKEQQYINTAIEKGNIRPHHEEKPDVAVLVKERNGLIMNEIERLPVIMKKCIVAYYYQEFSVEDIAISLKLDTQHVYHQLRRGRILLTERLGDFGPRPKRD